MSKKPKVKKDPNICWCNQIPKSRIEKAISTGADTLNKIFDRTTAGVGACGGSCRPYLQKMLDSYKETGVFPENPRPAQKKRR